MSPGAGARTTATPAVTPLTRDDVVQIATDVVNAKTKTWKIALSVAAAFLTAFGVLGFSSSGFREYVFRSLFPLDATREQLRVALSADEGLQKAVHVAILRHLAEHVDSGYSKTLYFGPGASMPVGQDILEFYASADQRVELSLNAQGPPAAQFALTVDNKNAFALAGAGNGDFPYTIVGRDIGSFLDFKPPSQLDANAERKEKQRFIHIVKVDPIQLPKNTVATFEVLVLVRNADHE